MRIGDPNNATAVNTANYTANLRLGSAKEKDSVSLNIQKQIKTLLEQKRSLAENDELTAEAKRDKATAIDDQIQGLRKQLLQRQLEIMQEKREKQAKAVREQAGQKAPEHEDLAGGMTTSAMQGMMEADAGLSQARSAHTVKVKAQSEERTLKDEIRTDAGRGLNLSWKQEELSNVAKRMEAADSVMSGRLADSNKHTEETGEAGREERPESGKTESPDAAAAGSASPKANGAVPVNPAASPGSAVDILL
jgi:hypothetical protein